MIVAVCEMEWESDPVRAVNLAISGGHAPIVLDVILPGRKRGRGGRVRSARYSRRPPVLASPVVHRRSLGRNPTGSRCRFASTLDQIQQEDLDEFAFHSTVMSFE